MAHTLVHNNTQINKYNLKKIINSDFNFQNKRIVLPKVASCYREDKNVFLGMMDFLFYVLSSSTVCPSAPPAVPSCLAPVTLTLSGWKNTPVSTYTRGLLQRCSILPRKVPAAGRVWLSLSSLSTDNGFCSQLCCSEL